MTDARQENKPRAWDRGVKLLATSSGAHILVAVQQQRRDVDAGQDVAQIRLCKRPRHRPQPGRMKLGHTRDELIDQLRRRRCREQRRGHGAYELTGWQIGQLQDLLQAPFHTPRAGREPAHPAYAEARTSVFGIAGCRR